MYGENREKLTCIMDKHKVPLEERESLLDIIMPIFSHAEFQKRMASPYFHHDTVTLGEHILEDAIVTYNLSKKYLLKKNDSSYNISLAIKIAMLHDLYTYPWQNNKEHRSMKFYNKHGFVHPIESVINSIYWYPDLFKNREDALKIIDGITHHMYPLPARRYDRKHLQKLELNNYYLIDKIDKDLESILITTSNKASVGPFSFRRRVCIEGRIMRKADRRVSYDNFKKGKNIHSVLALITGKNISLKLM